MIKQLISVLWLVALMPPAIATDTLDTRVLHYNLAQRAVLQALDECSKRGFKVSAALAGRDGNLLAFVRHPLSGAHTVQTAQAKAYTASSLQVTTDGMFKTRPDLSFAPGIVLIQGGLPISIAGHFYGGIAVAGADTKTDEDCANAGLNVINTALEFAN